MNECCELRDIMYCWQNDKYDDACYSHIMSFLIQFGKCTYMTFHNSYCQKRALLNHAFPWCVLAHTHAQYKCLLIPYNSTFLCAGTGGRQGLQYDVAAIRTWNIHQDLVVPHAFEKTCPIYSSMDICLTQWVMFHWRFLLILFQHSIGAILASIHSMQYGTISFI